MLQKPDSHMHQRDLPGGTGGSPIYKSMIFEHGRLGRCSPPLHGEKRASRLGSDPSGVAQCRYKLPEITPPRTQFCPWLLPKPRVVSQTQTVGCGNPSVQITLVLLQRTIAPSPITPLN